MNYVELVDRYFPFDSYRPNQKESIIEALETLNEKKCFILEAPTGAGKSGIAYTVGKCLDHVDGEKYTGPPIVICTRTRMLQNQYATEYNDIHRLWSAVHYKCSFMPFDKEFYYGSPMCLKKFCSHYNGCEYRMARNRFMNDAQIGVLNYNYFLANRSISPVTLILDECHNLEDVLCDHATVRISTRTTKKIMNYAYAFAIECDGNPEELATQIINIKRIDEDAVDMVTEYRDLIVELLAGARDAIKQYQSDSRLIDAKKLSNMIVSCMGLRDSLNQFIKSCIFEVEGPESVQKEFDATNWVISSQDKSSVIFKPLEIQDNFRRLIMSRCDHVLMESATICGPDQFGKTLGLNKSEYGFKSVPSSFPVERRKIYCSNTGSLNWNNKVFLLPEFTAVMDSFITELDSENELARGIIHSVSYENAQIIKENSMHKDRMVIPKVDDLMNVNSILGDKEGTIVVSPSILEGVDLVDSLSRFQFFPKVPYGFLGDKWIKTKMKMDSQWYARETIIKIVQGSGRSIRSNEDWAVTVILDSNFSRLLQNKDLFPGWYLEAVEVM